MTDLGLSKAVINSSFPKENILLINANSSTPAGKCGLLVRSLLTI